MRRVRVRTYTNSAKFVTAKLWFACNLFNDFFFLDERERENALFISQHGSGAAYIDGKVNSCWKAFYQIEIPKTKRRMKSGVSLSLSLFIILCSFGIHKTIKLHCVHCTVVINDGRIANIWNWRECGLWFSLFHTTKKSRRYHQTNGCN